MDLLKPLEVFDVEAEVKKHAKELQKEVAGLEETIKGVESDLKVQEIELTLPDLVNRLTTIKNDGIAVIEANEKIQSKLRSNIGQLSKEAKYLLKILESNNDKDFTELIIELRESNSEVFEEASQIIRILEELYRRNWINIKISRTTMS